MKWETVIISVCLALVCFMSFMGGKMTYDKAYIEGIKDGRDQIIEIAIESIDAASGSLQAWAMFTDKVTELTE